MNANSLQTASLVKTGADRLLANEIDRIKNKRIGILTNHTGCLSNGSHIVDALVESNAVSVTALFGPEHGILGNTPDGKVVNHSTDSRYHIPVYSLYGKIHKPTPEMLSNIDLLLCDIQDVGTRFYTFISTIAMAVEGAAENGIPVLILDRPNPIRGVSFDGPVRNQKLKSFVAWMPIPVTHGMTIGELAILWNEEGQLAGGVRASLEILPLQGWNRNMWYDETGLPWIAPSPNMPSMTTAVLYPGLCFIEGTTISEGRGTDSPFELIGAPWLNTENVISVLNDFQLSGVQFSSDEFIPKEIPGMVSEPKYEGEVCKGIRIKVHDRNSIEPVRLGIYLLSALKKIHPKEAQLNHRRFDILTGDSSVRKMLEGGEQPEKIFSRWSNDLQEFGKIRSRYLLYD